MSLYAQVKQRPLLGTFFCVHHPNPGTLSLYHFIAVQPAHAGDQTTLCVVALVQLNPSVYLSNEPVPGFRH